MRKLNLGGAVIAALFAANSFADAPAEPIKIKKIKYGGNGCPQDSASIDISDDNTAFTMIMDAYIAEIGPDVPRSENRKACQIGLTLKVPAGWQFSIATFDYRGYASLDKGVKGKQVASYYFQGQSGTTKFDTNIKGEFDDDFHLRDTVGLESFSPCNTERSLNIKTELRLSSSKRNASGIMTTDSIDGEIKQVYGLKWRRCR
jgi:hypothetical protein